MQRGPSDSAGRNQIHPPLCVHLTKPNILMWQRGQERKLPSVLPLHAFAHLILCILLCLIHNQNKAFYLFKSFRVLGICENTYPCENTAGKSLEYSERHPLPECPRTFVWHGQAPALLFICDRQAALNVWTQFSGQVHVRSETERAHEGRGSDSSPLLMHLQAGLVNHQ